MTRAWKRIRWFGALVALLLVATLGVGALPQGAGAQAQLPDGDDRPSCSLFPTRLGVGEWLFTNRRDFPITIAIARADGEVVFAGTLDGGASTPIFALTLDTVIHWAGDVYHLSAYELVDCLDLEGPLPTTTTVPATTVPGTTSSSVAPPESTTTTVAPAAATSLPTTATEAPTTGAPPVGATEPVAVEAVAVSRSDAAAAVATREDLPRTGFPAGAAVLGAVAAILAGLASLAVARRRQVVSFGEELHP